MTTFGAFGVPVSATFSCTLGTSFSAIVRLVPPYFDPKFRHQT